MRARLLLSAVTALFAVPLTGYALTEFLGADALWLVRASPATGPALLAGDAAGVELGDAGDDGHGGLLWLGREPTLRAAHVQRAMSSGPCPA